MLGYYLQLRPCLTPLLILSYPLPRAFREHLLLRYSRISRKTRLEEKLVNRGTAVVTITTYCLSY